MGEDSRGPCLELCTAPETARKRNWELRQAWAAECKAERERRPIKRRRREKDGSKSGTGYGNECPVMMDWTF